MIQSASRFLGNVPIILAFPPQAFIVRFLTNIFRAFHCFPAMTKKPLSTISFNTEEFLSACCRNLVKGGKVQSFLYVNHFAEQDTKKDHIHLLLIPCAPVDPMAIRKLFIEPCPIKGQGDLGCLPFVTSKVDDWLLYALHFPPYLLKKGLSRINCYSLDDVRTNEPRDYIEQLFNDASEGVVDSRIDLFLSRIKDGYSFGEILSSGLVPPSQVVFYDKLYRLNSSSFGDNLDDNFNRQYNFPGNP